MAEWNFYFVKKNYIGLCLLCCALPSPQVKQPPLESNPMFGPGSLVVGIKQGGCEGGWAFYLSHTSRHFRRLN